MEYYYYVYAILIFSGILGCSMLKDIIDEVFLTVDEKKNKKIKDKMN